MKKIALLDVDDLLQAFITGINGFNSYLVSVRPDISIKSHYLPKNWGYTELGDISKELNEYINKYSDEGLAFKGASEFTKKLKDMGMEVILLTAHPAIKTIDRMINLKKQGIIFDSLYCCSYYDENGKKIYKTKTEFAKALGLDKDCIFFFADDKASTTIDMLTNFKNCHVFTMQRDYNNEALFNLVNLFDEDKSRLHIVPGSSSTIPDNQVLALYEKVLEVIGETK